MLLRCTAIKLHNKIPSDMRQVCCQTELEHDIHNQSFQFKVQPCCVVLLWAFYFAVLVDVWFRKMPNDEVYRFNNIMK